MKDAQNTAVFRRRYVPSAAAVAKTGEILVPPIFESLSIWEGGVPGEEISLPPNSQKYDQFWAKNGVSLHNPRPQSQSRPKIDLIKIQLLGFQKCCTRPGA